MRYQTTIRRIYRRTYVQTIIGAMIIFNFVATSVENQYISTIEKGDTKYLIFKSLDYFFTVTKIDSVAGKEIGHFPGDYKTFVLEPIIFFVPQISYFA